MKRILYTLAGIMTMIIVFSTSSCYTFPFSSNIIDETTTDIIETDASGLVYEYLSDETYCVIKYSGTENNVTIPATYQGKPVTSIGDLAFSGCTSLTNISIPDSIISIGYNAFSGCSNLTYHTDGNTYRYLGNSNNPYLVLYEVSETTTIFNVHSSTKIIYSQAFYNCSSLIRVTLSDNVTHIGNYAFYGCSKLKKIDIPAQITSIGSSTFENCSQLASVTIPSGVTSIGDSAFRGCSNLNSIALPKGIVSIGNLAFGNCHSLTSISIPSTVNSIGNKIFDRCSNIHVAQIPISCLNQIPKSDLQFVVITDGDKIPVSAFSNCSKLKEVAISNTITSIEREAFDGCYSLESIVIPKSVKHIGENAFDKCHDLSSIYFTGSEEEWRSIDAWDAKLPVNANFYFDHKPLTASEAGTLGLLYTQIDSNRCSVSEYVGTDADVIIPPSHHGKTVTSIGISAFYKCLQLKTIVIPNSVTSISTLAFKNCYSLTDIYYTGTEQEWNAVNKTLADIPSTVTIHYNYVP